MLMARDLHVHTPLFEISAIVPIFSDRRYSVIKPPKKSTKHLYLYTNAKNSL